MERFLQDSDDEEGPIIPKRSDMTPKNVVKGWDKAKLLPPDGETQAFEDEVCYLHLLKALKILAYIVTFMLTLGGAVMSKATFLLMTSQLKPKRTVPYCGGKYQTLETMIGSEERISWTWAIFFSFAFPELMVLVRALRIWMFKVTARPSFFEAFIPFFFETCHTFGLALFAFAVLPSMNVVRGAMLTNAVCLLPTIFSLLSRTPETSSRNPSPSENAQRKWLILSSVDGLAIIFTLVGLTLWPIFIDEPLGKSWLLPLSCILISVGWWENYAGRNSFFKPIRMLGNLNLAPSRYTTNLFLPLWKIFVFGCGMVLSYWILGQGDGYNLFRDFQKSFKKHNITYSEVRPVIPNDTLPDIPVSEFYGIHRANNFPNAVIYAIVVQVLSAALTYLTSKFACKIGIQSFSFAFPLSLAVPVTLVTLVSFCGIRQENTCALKGVFAPYLFWECQEGDVFHDFIIGEHAWAWLLWALVQAWITIHIWNPKFRRLERGEILFVSPMYNGLLVDQSLTLNRRRQDMISTNITEENEEDEVEETTKSYKELSDKEDVIIEDDLIPKIYACATMWHEIKSEMKEMLKSVFRMDEDQAARRIARKYFHVIDEDYYEIETHIFFDDAFNKAGTVVNSYVKDFVDTLEEAASHVHETVVVLAPPKKYPTPYGGRLEWTLPGGTKLYVHLKNKNKIRHKKRWSQVMYMYYLLGHRLLERDIPVARKEVIGENTFILALDGDIDFKPQAVRLLVDLMRKNKTLGAACGRIHPIGSGLMVWYQMFEYAIGHWFQKATEHVIGCVLCSPGCFSLFRAKGLLDKNVMAKYTTKATEPRHFVQYDQGEDRWLCTLLLQQGYRVEYSAASDALTHCPEQFGEFFTQRRRWVPSTMANIIDLLADYKRTIRTNPDISSPYIAYQMLMMVGSILGPGSIFLMLIGAFNTAFQIPNWDAFLWNLVPVAIFVFACFFTSSEVQLIIAQILSAVYALIMVAVLVALLMQIQDDGLLAPTSLFLFMVAMSFVIAAILHPLEFGCLPYGIVYYITIPSMYLLLIIYSLMNLHIVSWGTREVAEEVSPEKAAAEAELKKKAEEANKKGGFLSYFIPKTKDEKEGSFEISFAGLFKLMCCTKPVDDEKFQLSQIATSLASINKRLDSIEQKPSNEPVLGEHGRTIPATPGAGMHPRLVEETQARAVEGSESLTGDDASTASERSKAPKLKKKEERNDLVNPEWIDDPDLKDGEVDFLPGVELTFWREMIDKYLLPLDKNPEKEKKIAEDLIALRNKTAFFFFMVNAVFVVAIFLLQNQKETIFIEWPLGSTFNMTYIKGNSNIDLQQNSLRLEPIGVVFVAVFALILGIQFVAMLFHRFATFSHILASTVIEWCQRDVDAVAKDSALEKEGLNLIRQLQKLKKEGGVNGRKSRTTVGDVARRKTIHNMEKSQDLNQKPANIESAFKATFVEVNQSPDKLLKRGRDARVTFQNLAQRRSTVLGRKASAAARRSGTTQGGSRESSTFSFQPQRLRNGSTFINPAFDPQEN